MGSLFSEVMDFNKGNGAVYNELKGLISVRGVNIIPFVGAGLSAGVSPLWSSMLIDIAAEFDDLCYSDGAHRKNVKEFIEQGDFEGAATYLSEIMGEIAFVKQVKERIGTSKIAWARVDKGCRLLPRLFKGGVVTINLDHVVEFVYESEEAAFSEIIIPRSEKDLTYIDRLCRKNSHVLLKLHGDICKQETLILTSKEYEDNYGGIGYRQILDMLFLTGSFLFLGCSLMQDRLIKVITQLAKEQPNREFYNFAILEAPAKEEFTFAERLKELSNIGISVIWYPHGKHDAVGAILKQLLIDTEGKNKSRRRLNPSDRNKTLGILGIILAVVGIATSVFFGLK
ncbi:MAG TPA: SIR2 family protein [Eubacteriales bacterium]|nr:SIR2 family protein [Eubacteriales bacterium]